MKSLSESPAILTVHQGSPGQYILRGRRDLIIGATKMLGDARSFVVVTDKDVKVFAVGDNGSPAAVEAEPDPDPEVSAEVQAAINQEESHSLPDTVADPEETTKVVKRKRPAQVAGHDESCARCGGTGKAKVILDGGSGAEVACPICKGEGMMKRYGARR